MPNRVALLYLLLSLSKQVYGSKIALEMSNLVKITSFCLQKIIFSLSSLILPVSFRPAPVSLLGNESRRESRLVPLSRALKTNHDDS